MSEWWNMFADVQCMACRTVVADANLVNGCNYCERCTGRDGELTPLAITMRALFERWRRSGRFSLFRGRSNFRRRLGVNS